MRTFQAPAALALVIALAFVATSVAFVQAAAEPNDGPAVAIEVNEAALDLSNLTPGDVAGPWRAIITNTGDASVEVTLEAVDGVEPLLTPGLKADNANYDDYVRFLESGDSTPVNLTLGVPPTIVGGAQADGTITVWGEVSGGLWEQFHGNAALTGTSPGDAPDSAALRWASDDIDCRGSSSFVVGEGKLFAYSLDDQGKGRVVALDLATGEVAWSEETLVSNAYRGWSTPAYHDGVVFTSGDGARDASDGSLVWGGLPDNTNGGPLVAEGRVYIGNWNGSQYRCFDEWTGAPLWDRDVVGLAQGTPAFSGGRVFVTSWAYYNASYLYCLDAATGEEIWVASSGDRAQSFCGSPCVSDGFVFLTTFNFYGLGTVRCVNASDGSLVWIKEIQRSDGTPAVHDGRLYVTGGVSGVSEHQTYCFDTVDGTPLWSTTVEVDIGGWTCSVVIADGKAFVGRDAGTVGEMGGRYVKLFALDEMTGAIRWEVDGCGATVAVFDGEVFSAGSDGRVYAFGP